MCPIARPKMRPFDCDLPQHCNLCGLVCTRCTVKVYLSLDLERFRKLKNTIFNLRLFRGLLRYELEIFCASYSPCQVVPKSFS